MALTAKQQRFVENYLLDLNSTQAAIRAGYSKGTADKQGPRLLAHPGVKAAIDAAKIKRSEKTETDAAWVLKRLHQQGAHVAPDTCSRAAHRVGCWLLAADN